MKNTPQEGSPVKVPDLSGLPRAVEYVYRCLERIGGYAHLEGDPNPHASDFEKNVTNVIYSIHNIYQQRINIIARMTLECTIAKKRPDRFLDLYYDHLLQTLISLSGAIDTYQVTLQEGDNLSSHLERAAEIPGEFYKLIVAVDHLWREYLGSPQPEILGKDVHAFEGNLLDEAFPDEIAPQDDSEEESK